jgi:putative transposase
MSWVSMYVHLVFSTKHREPFLNSPELRKKVFKHIKQNAAEKDIWLDCVNGWEDHAHCLISLGREQTLSKVAQLIKGESSFWINKNNLTVNKFVWQGDYWAAGVSISHVEAVRKYIHRQEEHHSRKSFAKEVNEFMGKHGWTVMKT